MSITYEADFDVGCVFAHLHQCRVYMPIQNEHSVSYISNVAAIFV